MESKDNSLNQVIKNSDQQKRQNDIRKVLGLNWNNFRDEFKFEFTDLVKSASELPATKRNILKVTAMFYDPLGLISPIVLQSKLVYQSLCKEKLTWDTIVSEPLKKQWDTFIDRLRYFEKVIIPRPLFKSYDENCFYKIHGFADASSEAYSSVIYIRSVTGNSNLTTLLCSKSRLAPSKSTTIPRLELSACLLLSKHVKSTTAALSKPIIIKNVCCWSDSLIALWWIKQTHKTWKFWIQNRVKKIRENVKIEHWNYVISGSNPADIATHYFSPNSLFKNLLWWRGPSFSDGSKEELVESKLYEKRSCC